MARLAALLLSNEAAGAATKSENYQGKIFCLLKSQTGNLSSSLTPPRPKNLKFSDTILKQSLLSKCHFSVVPLIRLH